MEFESREEFVPLALGQPAPVRVSDPQVASLGHGARRPRARLNGLLELRDELRVRHPVRRLGRGLASEFVQREPRRRRERREALHAEPTGSSAKVMQRRSREAELADRLLLVRLRRDEGLEVAARALLSLWRKPLPTSFLSHDGHRINLSRLLHRRNALTSM